MKPQQIVTMAQSMDRNEIIDRLGADDWEMVIGTFSGMHPANIKSELEYMFPDDEDNATLTVAIMRELDAS